MDGAEGAVIPATLAGLPVRWVLAGGALLLSAALVGWQRVQIAECRAALAEHQAAYMTLAQQVQIQQQAMEALERKAAAARSAGLQARQRAKKVAEHARARADALAAAVAAPVAPSATCSDALAVVRNDLTAP